jgi:hypothetical protein
MRTRERDALPNGGTARGRHRRRILLPLLGGLGGLIAAGGPAAAQAPTALYDTTRVLEHLGNECGGQPGCVTVESRRHRVAAGQSAIVAARCPANHPYVTGWDTEQHEHLAAQALPPRQRSGSAASRSEAAEETISRVRIGVANHGDAAGHITVFVGCSAEAPRVASVRRNRSGVPSNHGTFTGGSR